MYHIDSRGLNAFQLTPSSDHYRRLPHPRLSFRWCVALPLELLFLDWLCTGRTHTATLQHMTIGRSTCLARPGGTPSRGCRRRNRRRKPSCTSRRRWVEEAGIAGRSRRSRCRRCSLRTRCRGRRRRRGSRRCRDAPVGAPPEGNAKEVTRRRRRVTTAASRDDSVVAHGSLPAAWSGSGTVARGGHW
jgi:hypothetical protein